MANPSELSIKVVPVEKSENLNVIIGQSHFIKTVEDIHEAIANAGGGIQFGIAFLEASGPCLVRQSGNRKDLMDLAVKNALNIGAGHAFLVFLDKGYPVNILNSVKMVPEVCRIFCATANPVQVIIGETSQGRAILGVVDGFTPKGIEGPDDVASRKSLLRQVGYKL